MRWWYDDRDRKQSCSGREIIFYYNKYSIYEQLYTVYVLRQQLCIELSLLNFFRN